MQVSFSAFVANATLITNSAIYVVIKRSKFQKSPPKFMNLPYSFFVSENLKPTEAARNVSLVVKELHDSSVYDSGFYLDLLNVDLTFADDTFEIVPNYGVGLVVSTLRLREKARLDYENGRKRYDLVVSSVFIF